VTQQSQVKGPYKVGRFFEDKPVLPSGNTLVLGTFDGVHQGHQVIIKQAKELTNQVNLPANVVVFTFNTIPKSVVFPHNDIKHLLLDTTKSRLLLQTGADLVVYANFDAQFAAIEASEFVKNILIHSLGAARIVVGYNYTFGRGGIGDVRTLRDLASDSGVRVIVVPPQLVDGVEVSSTLIRQLLSSGQCEQANKLLGRPYALEGTVVSGEKIGSVLGFPTANIRIPDSLLIPKPGVYLSYVRYQSGEPLGFAATSIGASPTVGKKKITVETHIPGFFGDLYSKALKVELWQYLRPMYSFAGLEELKKQIVKDVRQVRELAQRYGCQVR
jgi:riboflavin kinase/FMN adenylyltransferase